MNGQYNIGDVVLHNWTLTELLGEGSYGKVYKAVRRDIAGEYVAAIKIISIPKNEEEKRAAFAEGMTESSVSDYFRSVVDDMSREFTLMSKLKGDSNIVSYEDHDIIPHPDGIGWDIIIRMELLIPFSSIIERGELPPKEIIKLGIDLCRALELCRKHSIIHRDIKPANIFKSETGQYKLGDFGVARTIEKTTGGVTKAGTYNYMAPEVYREEPYGATVDIYSLGLVLYQLLNNNRLPFLPPYPDQIRKSDRDSALAKRMSGEEIPYPAKDYGRLSDIVLKACEYDPRDRYRTPEEMRRDLQTLISNDGESKSSNPKQAEPKAQNVPKRTGGPETRKTNEDRQPGKGKKPGHKKLLAGVIIVLLLAVSFIGAAVLRNISKQRQYHEAENLLANARYDEALNIYTSLGDYRDASEKAEEIQKIQYESAMLSLAESKLEDGEYLGAREIFLSLGEYQNAAEMAKECLYRHASAMLTFCEENNTHWIYVFCSSDSSVKSLISMPDSVLTALGDEGVSRLEQCFARDGVQINYEESPSSDIAYVPVCEATALEFEALGDYKDSKDLVARARAAGNYNAEFYQLLADGELEKAHEWLSLYGEDIPNADQYAEWIVTYNNFCKHWTLSGGDVSLIPFSAGVESPDVILYEFSPRISIVDDTVTLTISDEENTYSVSLTAKLGETVFTYQDQVDDEASYNVFINDYGFLIYDRYGESITLCEYKPLHSSALGSSNKDIGADTDDPVHVTNKINEPTSLIQKGSTVLLGSYEQDNNKANGWEDIEWIVLDIQGDKALLLSKYALDSRLFNDTRADVTWEDCSIRTWLNNNFLNTAFTAKERGFIPTFAIRNDGGNITQDRIFLLSQEELDRYCALDESADYDFSSDAAFEESLKAIYGYRICEGTPYSFSQGLIKNNSNSSRCAWWLRTPGRSRLFMTIVNDDGTINPYNVCVDYGGYGVRPAMWVYFSELSGSNG